MGRAERSRQPGIRPALLTLVAALALITGCSGLLQNLGAKWATNKIAKVFDMDDEQREATHAVVDRAIEKASELLGPRLDMLVATVDRALATGMIEKNMLIVELGWRAREISLPVRYALR